MRFMSLFLSIALHIALLAFALYVPLSPPVDLTRPVYQVSLVMGAPGGENIPLPYWGLVLLRQKSRCSPLLLCPRQRSWKSLPRPLKLHRYRLLRSFRKILTPSLREDPIL